jgi:hypothetical protein
MEKGYIPGLIPRLACGRLEMGLEKKGASDVELDVYSHFLFALSIQGSKAKGERIGNTGFGLL